MAHNIDSLYYEAAKKNFDHNTTGRKANDTINCNLSNGSLYDFPGDTLSSELQVALIAEGVTR